MWNERRMTSGPRQTKAGAASCPLDAIGEDRPGPWCATVVSTGGRAGRRLHRTPSGHHLHSGADVIRHQNVREESRPGTTSRRRATPERTETGRAAPNEGGTRPSCGSSRSIPRNDRSRSGLRPRTGGGTPRAIARIEVRAIGSAMWLVRCCCRRGPHRIPAPALVESRPSRSREPVSGGSCHLRSGVLARPNRARGTNVAVGRVARLPYGVTTRNGRLELYNYVYKT